MSQKWTTIESPVGELLIRSRDGAVTAIEFSPFELPADGRDDTEPVLRAARDQLRAYFEGTRTEFDLPMEPAGTEFQRKVWRALCTIPYGKTASYGEIAGTLGLRPGASRAVGTANGANPIPIVVPCHRVIGSDGSLTGYGGGLDRKQILLRLEAPALF
jgi:methylated-DNA-[protein]-cysteine S-methyltransferase